MRATARRHNTLTQHTTQAQDMEIRSAEYVTSNTTVSECPAGNKPEYAFIGRSNVGKSSLINMLCNRPKLAKTSSTPGKTVLINHFIVNNAWHIVDLPGYGYAKRSKTERDKFEKMIRTYMLQRRQLTCVFLLVDIRHKQQAIDREFIDWLGMSRVPFAIVFTKADKLGPVRAKENAAAYMKGLEDTWEELPTYFITSSEKRTGREDILNYIDNINKELSRL